MISNISEKNRLNILVVGGSRGALAFNKYLPKILQPLLTQKLCDVRHQVGKNRLQATQEYYASCELKDGTNLQLSEFIDDMASAFDWADIVICRAGASTVAEISVVGLCAIFIPYPYAVDDHQLANANWLVKQNGASLVLEGSLLDEALHKNLDKISSQNLGSIIQEFINYPDRINQIANNAKKFAYLGVAEEIAGYCDVMKEREA